MRMWDRRPKQLFIPDEQLETTFHGCEEMQLLQQIQELCKHFEARNPDRCVGLNFTIYLSRDGWNATRRMKATDPEKYERRRCAGNRSSVYWAGVGWRRSGAAPRNHARDTKVRQ